MAGQFILVFFAAIALGVVLLVLGFRGRRLNRRPTCRSCRFDLSGTLPDGVTCPECGAGLKRERAVRIGQRKRMWVVATVGALLVVLPSAGLAAAVYAVLTGAEINQYKPFALLLWEAEHASNPKVSEAVAKEFSRRRQTKSLGEPQALRVIDAALAVQADPSRTWCEEWGDFIEMSQTDGIVREEQYQQFLDNAVVLACELRPRVESGRRLPLGLSRAESRVGSGSMIPVSATVVAVRFDGKEVELDGSYAGQDGTGFGPGFGMGFGMGFGGGMGMPAWNGVASGAKSPWGMSWDQPVTCLLKVPDDLPPGRHQIEFELRVAGQKVDTSGMLWSSSPGSEAGGQTRTLASSFEIVPRGAVGIEVVEPTEDLGREIADAIGDINGWIMASPFTGRQVQLQLDASGSPHDLAMQAYLRLGNQHLRLGPVLYHAEPKSATGLAAMVSMGDQPLSGKIGKVDITGASLVLRPDPDLALDTTNITRVYGGEIVIESLTIHNMDESGLVESVAGDGSEEGEPEGESGGTLGGLLRGLFGGG